LREVKREEKRSGWRERFNEDLSVRDNESSVIGSPTSRYFFFLSGLGAVGKGS
jgi:hypothetical protein